MQPRVSSALRVALGYGVIAGLWILLSDTLLASLTSDQASLARLGVFKGWAFVTVTAVLLFLERRRSDARFATELGSEQHHRNERERAEEALGVSQARLSGIIESAMDAIITIDEEQRITFFNPAAEQVFSCSAAEVIGQPLGQLLPEGSRSIHHQYVQVFGESGDTRRTMAALGELSALRSDGEEFPIEVSISAHEAGGQKFYTAILRDITERKRAEEALRKAHDELELKVQDRTAALRELNLDLENQAAQLEAANRELEAFSYSVSHDLRAPLRAIDGYTNVLVEDYGPALGDEGKRVCNVISSEAHRMGELIDDLLALSRVGRVSINTTQIEMKTLAKSVYERLTRLEARGRIDFQIGALPRSEGDPILIQQVWANLIGNAIKYSSAREQAIIEVGGKRAGGETIYFVRDNGAGFDMEYAGKLFGTFQRLHSEREFEGTGVGLAIVQRIVQRHGGRVWGEGEVDRGATFYFALPRNRVNHD